MLLRCNIDMRVVACHVSLLAYLLKYVSKAESRSLTLVETIKNLCAADEAKTPFQLV